MRDFVHSTLFVQHHTRAAAYSCNGIIVLLLHIRAAPYSCNIIHVQHHTRAPLYSCNIICVKRHTRATSYTCNVILLQHHTCATSYSCNIIHMQRHTCATSYSGNIIHGHVIYTIARACIVQHRHTHAWQPRNPPHTFILNKAFSATSSSLVCLSCAWQPRHSREGVNRGDKFYFDPVHPDEMSGCRCAGLGWLGVVCVCVGGGGDVGGV